MAGKGNSPSYGGRAAGSRPAGSSRQLPQGTLVDTLAGGGLAANTPGNLGAISKGGRSTTNSQPVGRK